MLFYASWDILAAKIQISIFLEFIAMLITWSLPPQPLTYCPHHHQLSTLLIASTIYLLSTVYITTTTIYPLPSLYHYQSSMNLTTTTVHPLSSPSPVIHYPHHCCQWLREGCHNILPSLNINIKHHCHRSTGGGHPWRNRTMRTYLTMWLQRRCWKRSIWGTTPSSPRSSRYKLARATDWLFSWLFSV